MRPLPLHVSLIFCSLCVLSIPRPLSAQIPDSIGSIFESKQERYEREQAEQRQAELERRRLEESLAQQQAEMRALEAERRRLEGGAAKPRAATTQVYVVADCIPCFKTIGFLDALNVEYEVLEVDTSHDVEQLYLQRFGRGAVPVIETRAGVVRGYRPSEIRRLFAKPQPTLPAAQGHSRKTPTSAAPATSSPRERAQGAGTAPAEDQFDVSSSLEDASREDASDTSADSE